MMHPFKSTVQVSLILLLCFLGSACASSTILSTEPSTEIDRLVTDTMSTFNVPGVAIGIIKDGKVTHLKGYGVANIDSGLEVNKDTIFKIASNSKAFTAAVLALLVEQGKLDWHDKVSQYLPNFKMHDPWVSEEFNIIDLLTHRSGLGIGAGDLMLWPEPTKFSRDEVIKNLRYLKPVTSFRDQYAYDNLLYIVAGEVVANISGVSWEAFVEQQLFQPLSMNNCFAGGIDTKKVTNIVAPHVVLNDQLQVDQPNVINNKTSLMAAAGGIKCSVADLSNWVTMLLNEGLTQSGEALISKQQRDVLWQSVTRLPISERLKNLEDINYRGYALGWRVSDYFGHWKVSHTGSLSGSRSQIILFPNDELGIIILSNQSSSAARSAMARGIMQLYIPQNTRNWVEHYSPKMDAVSTDSKLIKTVATPMSKSIKPSEKTIPERPQYQKYLGEYLDPWFGRVTLSRSGKNITFKADKSPRLKGTVYYFRKNQWWVKWSDRSFHADAWIRFELDEQTQKIKMTMQSISETADFSFDFEDLNFIKSL